MTARILVVIFNLVIIFFLISSIEGDHLRRTWLLGLLLFAMNAFLAFYLRRKPTVLSIALQSALGTCFRWTTWIYFFPIVTGAVVVIVGLAQFSWKAILLGVIAIMVGSLRLMLRYHLMKTLEGKK